MNFLFYKNLSKKYFFLFLFFLGVVIGFSRCVPIEDLIDPTIGEFSLNEQYNITDTIFLDVVLFDNFGLDIVKIDINKIGSETSSLNSTKIINSDSIKAKLLKLEQYEVIEIPLDAALGQYEFTLSVTDISGKEQTIKKNFIVNGDVSDPDLVDIELDLDLDIDVSIKVIDLAANSYQACRSSTIPITGTASDNIALSTISAQFDYPNSPIISFDLGGVQSIDLASIFEGLIQIPSDVPNGTTINLTFKVTDDKQNSSSATLSFLIDCDDTRPIVNSIITNLDQNINEQNEIEVIQGQELFIIDGQITDNDALDSLFIYFIEGNTETIILEEKIEGNNFNLANAFGDIAVPIPSNNRIDNRYKISVVATDTSANQSVAFISDILITRNNPPDIDLGLNYIDNNPTTFSTNSRVPTPIPAGSSIRTETKIVEDVALDNFKITWAEEGGEEIIVTDLNQNDLEGVLIINITQQLTRGLLKTRENAREGTRYILNIYARDTFQQENQITYYFIVQ